MKEKNRFRKILLPIIAVVLIASIVFSIIIVLLKEKNKNTPNYVIHATGGFGQEIYLNSQESLNYYIEQGFTLFEVDFLYTKDNAIVCSHEFENMGEFSKSNRPTYDEFMSTLIHGKYHPLNLGTLIETVKQNPQVTIIFDTKESDKLAIFQDLYSKLRNFDFDTKKNLIAQFYTNSGYQAIKDYEVKEFWFTNYAPNNTHRYTQQQIVEYFGTEKNVTTIVLSNFCYPQFKEEGIIFDKKIAVHGIEQIYTKSNTTYFTEVDYIFIHSL